MPKPELTFFCELHTEQLTRLFEDRFVIDDLNNLGAVLSLGILDLSEERAEVVKRLNKAGLPMVAWLLLPEEDGYWFNVTGSTLTIMRKLSKGTSPSRHGLRITSWNGLGSVWILK